MIDTRNGLFYGFFYVAMGCWLKQKKGRSIHIYWTAFIVGLVLLAIESLIAMNKLHATSTVLWLTCPIPVAGLFMICKNIEINGDTSVFRKISSLIYFSHYFWIYVLRFAGIKQGMVLFVSVFIITAFCSTMIVRISEKTKMLKYIF